ncbi:hypothetical protein, partial [Pseudonocardia lacus]|uniref:hypothetical protein n=1 Tax=Pseudonocardia lacus TaxID=2835865 RepID=UPI002027BD8F
MATAILLGCVVRELLLISGVISRPSFHARAPDAAARRGTDGFRDRDVISAARTDGQSAWNGRRVPHLAWVVHPEAEVATYGRSRPSCPVLYVIMVW